MTERISYPPMIHIHRFTFRAFSRCIYPKQLTISTFVRRKRNNNVSLPVQGCTITSLFCYSNPSSSTDTQKITIRRFSISPSCRIGDTTGQRNPISGETPSHTTLSYITSDETRDNRAAAHEKPSPAEQSSANNSAHSAACLLVMLKLIPCGTRVHFQLF